MKLTKEKLTPKQLAAKIIARDLEIVTGYWEERWNDGCALGDRKLTEAQCMAVQEQLNKFEARIMKMIGHK